MGKLWRNLFYQALSAELDDGEVDEEDAIYVIPRRNKNSLMVTEWSKVDNSFDFKIINNKKGKIRIRMRIGRVWRGSAVDSSA